MTDLSEIKVTDRFSLKDKNFLITGGGKSVHVSTSYIFLASLNNYISQLAGSDSP